MVLSAPLDNSEFVLEMRRRVASLEEKCVELQSGGARIEKQINGISRWLNGASIILAMLLTAIISEIGWRSILF